MIVGYYSLKTGFIADNERRVFLGKRIFDSIPGVELVNFAVNDTYKYNNPEYKVIVEALYKEKKTIVFTSDPNSERNIYALLKDYHIIIE
ncbi:MAG: hypothetical protein K6F69_06495 [Treponema sp.]|nr:hypothetical protein [Treponema sp.]